VSHENRRKDTWHNHCSAPGAKNVKHKKFRKEFKVVEIRPVTTEAEYQEIYRFRYEVYIEEMQRTQMYADHHRKMIVEPLDKTAKIYGAWLGNKIVGTTRINYARDSELGYYEKLYNLAIAKEFYPDCVSITTKMMVSKTFRSSHLGLRMALAVYKGALENGIHFDFIDCNRHLKPLFIKMGYRPYRESVVHPEYGEVMPMILALRDVEHFKSVDSPFLRVCQRSQFDSLALDFFDSMILGVTNKKQSAFRAISYKGEI
jgi:hypothetical protein